MKSKQAVIIFIAAAGLMFSACSMPLIGPEEKAPTPSGPPEHLPQIGAKTKTESAPFRFTPLAVVHLMSRTKELIRSGELDQAFAAAERAVRIDPSNPEVWNLLAEVQLKRGNVSQAEHLARKSNLLASGDSVLQAKNWRIIADVLRRRGQTGEADEARRKAEELEK